jgi:hypothetical protein
VPFFDVLNGQVLVFNADCSPSSVATSTDANGQITIQMSGATAGHRYIISVKYSTNSITGVAVPSPASVHYDFRTLIGSTIVDRDASGVDLEPKP